MIALEGRPRRIAIVVATLVATAITVITAAYVGTLFALALLGVAVLFAVTLVKPEAGISAWLGSTIFIPEWTRLYELEPATVTGIPVAAALILSDLCGRQRFVVRLGLVDFALLLAVSIIVLQLFLGFIPGFAAKDAVFVWMLAYFLGRRSTTCVQNVFVILMVATALWGMAEFALDFHAFETWGVGDWHNWNRIQDRAGQPRSEAALGHAIAYGASLALAIPFAGRMRQGLVFQVLLCSGVVVSLSRGPLLAMVVTLALTTWCLKRGKGRKWSLVPLSAGVLAATIVVVMLYLNPTSSSRVQSSSLARLTQLDEHLSSLHWLTSSLNSGEYGVIDGTPLRLAVNFGIFTTVLLLSPIMQAGYNLLTGKEASASVALIGQVCILSVTSLIVQWPALIFFIAGAVVTERRYNRRLVDG